LTFPSLYISEPAIDSPHFYSPTDHRFS
jgi:hypothetical protein